MNSKEMLFELKPCDKCSHSCVEGQVGVKCPYDLIVEPILNKRKMKTQKEIEELSKEESVYIRLWSKHITSKKYEKTGKTEKVIKTDGNTQIIDEYIGKDGKVYWGYDHLWSPDTFANPEEAKASLDLYTAIFNEKDLPKLKKFIAGIKVKTSLPEYDYLDSPKAVDMIFRKDVDHGHMGY